MREMRAIAFVTDLIPQGTIDRGEMKEMPIHSIRADDAMCALCVSNKYNADWAFPSELHDHGRLEAAAWLAHHYGNIGQRSSTDIRREFL
ncbi:hypothetical protein WS46_28360 [Burkholderia sp. RF4-BP95]|nr:hypothetical protein WS46_28360 [Burkholderia sp. RF4-BP95]